MKKVTFKSLLLALPVFFMVSCKPTLNVTSDYDRSTNFSAYKTFSLYYLVTNRNVSELNEDRIWNSIRAEMLRKGYTENHSNPDLVVNAVSVVKNKRYLSANTNFYGYGGAYRPYGYWGGYGATSGSTTVQANNYKDGSLMIDVIDAKTQRLIWEGTGTAEFEKQPKNPEEVISNAVTKIMATFPQGKPARM
ncbi:MAG: DUF4136 domain-containing protein [Chitinophagaceae bacterium]|nr:DUF4136 domain-containing protein [Chitinophagaceae bacterium]